MNDDVGSSPQSRFDLSNRVVHVWHFDALSELVSETSLLNLLSDRERAKIARLKHPMPRKRHLHALAKLRVLLGIYLQKEPQVIEFEYGDHGKPYLSDQTIEFNLTHSGDHGLIAIADRMPLGIDLECWHQLKNREQLVRRYFSDVETEAWAALNESDKERVFFRLWTCKEAFMKATGRGLGLGLGRCAFDWNDPPRLLMCPDAYGEPDDWTVLPIQVQAGASATLVVKSSTKLQVINHRWSDEMLRSD